MKKPTAVTARRETINIPTYEPMPPDKNPMFHEQRVYQGSSGRVYPLPCVERISEKATDHEWNAVILENEFIEITILPELGGRIHAAKDKLNGYDFVYRNNVIKPALVGLCGPWVSGGIEFNWPQHHRPTTYMPADVEIEEADDGSVTVWMSEHDAMARMQGMHGVRLCPGKAVIELDVRVCNRTPFVQTFLWWANVATCVHEAYQSFFPADVTAVYDHAKCATSTFPHCSADYYGVQFKKRAEEGVPKSEIPRQFVPPHCMSKQAREAKFGNLNYKPDDLSWYANIPVPTSYMCAGTDDDFFGGYDYFAKAGIVHVANRHIAPGKKQWTWGNHEFGYAWDRNLTDPDENGVYRPYIELMAGVFSDNQPDFTYLQPGESKIWTQYWYPIREIGTAQKANTDAALHLQVTKGEISFGLAVTHKMENVTLRLNCAERILLEEKRKLTPFEPILREFKLPRNCKETDLVFTLVNTDGNDILSYVPISPVQQVPVPATEPPAPEDIKSCDELFITGLHLVQYRHPTRMPEPYFKEALKRDPLDSRCNNAMGKLMLERGLFEEALYYLKAAVKRLTMRNPNPYDGEAYYNLGLTLRYLGEIALSGRKKSKAEQYFHDAYAALYKAVWNQAWRSAAYHAIAELDCRNLDWTRAEYHLKRSLVSNSENFRARDLLTSVLRQLNKNEEADHILQQTLKMNPLDWWAKHLAGHTMTCDTQTRFDIALDYVRAGFYDRAYDVLAGAQPEDYSGTAPMLAYLRAWILHLSGKNCKLELRAAQMMSPDYCFPVRLEEMIILKWVSAESVSDRYVNYYLGNMYYDRRRHTDAVLTWEKASRLNPDFAPIWRNLGLACHNYDHENAERCLELYDAAFECDPSDSGIFFERDLAWKNYGIRAEERLAVMEHYPDLVASRDDLTIEYAALLNQVGRHEDALKCILSRRFQPWEGGEGSVCNQYERTMLAFGKIEYARKNWSKALDYFEKAMQYPESLGESKHLLVNRSDIDWWIACAAEKCGKKTLARRHWQTAASFLGSFQDRTVSEYSEMTYFSALAMRKLGRTAEADELLKNLKNYARRMYRQEAKIFYFATSLPSRLLFFDVQRDWKVSAKYMEAQALAGLNQIKQAKEILKRILHVDPSKAQARDLLEELEHLS